MRQMTDDLIMSIGFGFVVGTLFALVGFRHAVPAKEIDIAANYCSNHGGVDFIYTSFNRKAVFRCKTEGKVVIYYN